METHITEFWSDSIEAPKSIMRPLSDRRIAARITRALNLSEQTDGDLFAARGEDRFCFIKINGVVKPDPESVDENGKLPKF